MSSTAKAKSAKLAPNSLALSSTSSTRYDVQKQMLVKNITWAKGEKRIFFKHSLESRLVGL
ncbi:hypothetical protein DFP72DRAFT_909907 [Ephemerocybe angulata]|uniref:26S proteasome regulatory subunit Rpn6 N-terminal domain-containing protein n=1 Tax=Ephemerocybe angulata TaxID=980116 RepID=A0A8H6HQT6_9AGAR|nr:hypothetical protein DFP72DRAFT_909907 [Tulosesus angulatus]